jgi:pyruvate kinase
LRSSKASIGHLHDNDGDSIEPVVSFTDGAQLLRPRSTEVLGPEPDRRQTRIMVTLPTEAAGDQRFVQTLLATSSGDFGPSGRGPGAVAPER